MESSGVVPDGTNFEVSVIEASVLVPHTVHASESVINVNLVMIFPSPTPTGVMANVFGVPNTQSIVSLCWEGANEFDEVWTTWVREHA